MSTLIFTGYLNIFTKNNIFKHAESKSEKFPLRRHAVFSQITIFACSLIVFSVESFNLSHVILSVLDVNNISSTTTNLILSKNKCNAKPTLRERQNLDKTGRKLTKGSIANNFKFKERHVKDSNQRSQSIKCAQRHGWMKTHGCTTQNH